MSGIQARSTLGKLEEHTSGKDLRKEQFITGQPVGSGRRALDTIALGVYSVIDSVAVEAGSDNNLVKITAHTARKGDFLRILTSSNNVQELEVVIDEIVDANNFRLGAVLSADLSAGDTVSILRPITPRMSSTGATLAQLDPSPIIFTLDGANQEVTEDTATPANNRPLPVKLMGVNGTLNLNANDLDISSSHTEDSMAIGDGTDLLDINSDGSINALEKAEVVTEATMDLAASPDAEGSIKNLRISEYGMLFIRDLWGYARLGNIISSIDTMSAKFRSARQLADDSTAVTLSFEDFNLLTDIDTQATSAAQAASQTAVATGDGGQTKQLNPDAPVTTLEALQRGQLQKLLDIDTKLADQATAANQGTANTSLSSIDTKMDSQATAAKQDLAKGVLDNIDTDLGAPADAAVTNPASSASVIAALKGLMTLITSTNTKLDTIDNNTSANLDSVSNNTTVTNTLISAPANARFMVVQNSTEASSAIRFTPSAQTPSATVGFFLAPGQSTSMIPAGSIRTISFDGTAIDVSVLWFV